MKYSLFFLFWAACQPIVPLTSEQKPVSNRVSAKTVAKQESSQNVEKVTLESAYQQKINKIIDKINADLEKNTHFSETNFVQEVFSEYKNLPQNLQEQSKEGVGVSFFEIRKADLVFFGKNKKIDKVGLVLDASNEQIVFVWIWENKLKKQHLSPDLEKEILQIRRIVY